MLSKIEIIGNLVADAEERNTSDGRSFLTFKVAVNDSSSSNPEEKKVTYFDVTYSRTAVVQYLKKGKFIYVSGKLSLSSSSNGEKTYFNASVSAKDLVLLG